MTCWPMDGSAGDSTTTTGHSGSRQVGTGNLPSEILSAVQCPETSPHLTTGTGSGSGWGSHSAGSPAVYGGRGCHVCKGTLALPYFILNSEADS